MAAIDDFPTRQSAGIRNPATHAASVTPSDSVDLSNVSRWVIIGTAGALKVTTKGGDTVTMGNVPAGFLPIQVTRIWSTGTTASNLTVLW